MYAKNSSHILIKTGEISLKKGNRQQFEQRLFKQVRLHLDDKNRIANHSGRTLVSLNNLASDAITTLIEKLKIIPGISGFAICSTKPLSDIQQITEEALLWLQHSMSKRPDTKSFAIRVKRVNKTFPHTSKEIEMFISKSVHALYPKLQLDLGKAELKINIEIRKNIAIFYTDTFEGIRGLPFNHHERVLCLLSGGLDSPVAAYEMIRKGMTPVLVHFHSHPYTSELSIKKVEKLAQLLSKISSSPLELWLVPFLDIQQQIRDHCNSRYLTVHYRRFMLKIAEEIAKKRDAKALVTGDSLGQVASQTLNNLSAIEEGTNMPIFRPLLCLDKENIIQTAKQIGSYDISIQPHDDACTLFASKKPTTEAKRHVIHDDESHLPQYKMIYETLDLTEKRVISFRKPLLD